MGGIFYRTNAGAEIDLLLFDDKNEPIAVEIKYSAGPKVKRGFWNACEDIYGLTDEEIETVERKKLSTKKVIFNLVRKK